MKIAISLFGDRISPRFDVAPEIGFYECEGVKITNSKRLSCEGWNEVEMVRRLKEQGIRLLICGGIPSDLHHILLINGIKVFPWVTGDIEDTLEKFLGGQIKSDLPQRRKKHRVKKRKR